MLLIGEILEPYNVVFVLLWHLKGVKNFMTLRVPRLTETKPKYRNETEIPERNIKIIGNHIQVPKWLMDNTNSFLI